MKISKITVPVINSNEDEYKIVKWNFKNKDFINKGDHVVTLESTKVAEEIYSDTSGYIQILSLEGSDTKAGNCIAKIYDNKNDIHDETIKPKEEKITITSKAKRLISENKLSLDIFKDKKLIKEKDVLEILQKKKGKNRNMLLIFFKNKKPYHAAIYIENYGIADLSLLGSRITPAKDYNFEDLKLKFFEIEVENISNLVKFLRTPVTLTDKIIKKEKNSRGWFKTSQSADYILNFRKTRSKNIDDVNCIEWLILALETISIILPNNILTAEKLLSWSIENLNEIESKSNLDFFKNLYN
jgi:hypothetical protein